jgi:VanZ family protein
MQYARLRTQILRTQNPELRTLISIWSLFMESEQMGSAGSDTRSSPGKSLIPPCGLAALILLFSSTPGSYYPKHPDFLNSIVHLMEFGLLSFLLARAFDHNFSITRVNLFLWTTATCVLFGLLDEAHQFLVPERMMFDLMDLFFDSLGAVAGSGSYIILRSLKADSSETRPATTGDMND